MSDIPQDRWDLAKLLHETRERFCWGNHQSHHRQKWPGDEVTPHNYGHNPQPWVDIALEQAKAVLKNPPPRPVREVPRVPFTIDEDVA